jgi:hypothetical protein
MPIATTELVTLVICGGGAPVKETPLLDTPPTVTTTFPLANPEGTFAAIDVLLQPVAVAAMPPNVTVLAP